MPEPGSPLPVDGVVTTGTPELVGREREVSRLSDLVEKTARGSGGVAIIHGEAGIGKTRLLAETRSRATSAGVDCVVGLCQERDQGVPYAPWVHILRELVDRAPKALVFRVVGEHRPAVRRLLPELDEQVWLHDPEVVHPREFQGAEFLESVARTVLALAETHPVMIELDDLGWADSGTLELLAVLGRGCAGHPLAIVAAYRDAHREANRALDRALLEVERARYALDLTPRPLTRGEMDLLIRSAWSGREAGRGFRQVVWRRSGGNPFFAVEILRSLSDAAGLTGEWEPGDAAAEARLHVPVGIRGVISQRLDRLDDSSRKSLRVASLLGLEFSFGLLETVAQVDEETLLTSMEQALSHRLVDVVGSSPDGTTYAFAHPLIQEVLAAEVGPDRSRRIHLRAARAIEQPRDSSEVPAASLAYHYLRANDAPMALRFSILAGDRAARLCAASDAVIHYRTALRLLAEQPDLAVSAQVLNALAAQLSILGDYGAAVKCLVEAAGQEQRLGNMVRAGSLMAQAALTVWSPREFRPKEDQLQQARALLEGTTASSELAQLYLDNATLVAKRGRLEEARALLARSLEVAKTVGNRSAEAAVHLAYAQLVPPGGRSEVERELRTALELTATDSPEMELRVHHLFALFAGYGFADLAACSSWIGTAARAFEGKEVPLLLARTEGGVGCFVALNRGDLEDARRRAETYREFLGTHGQPECAHNLVMLGALATLAGDFEGAAQSLLRAQQTYSEEEGWTQDLWLGVYAGQLALARGDSAGAEAEYDRGLQVLRQRGRVEFDAFLEVLYLAGLVEASVLTRPAARVRTLVDELDRVSEVVGGAPSAAFARRARAQVSSAEGHLEIAVEEFHRSVALWREAEWRLECGRDLRAVAELTGHQGNRSESDRLRGEALALFEAVGSQLDIARTGPTRAPSTPPVAEPSPASRHGRGRRATSKVPGPLDQR